MSPFRKRLDSNHKAIVEAFRKCGYLVMSTSSLGQGFGDLVVARPFKPDSVQIIEIKTPRGKLRETQQQFTQAGWPVVIVRSVDQVLEEAK